MKRLAPETFRGSSVRWQLFVTLTWRGQPPRAERRERLLRWFLRMAARMARVPYDRLIWIARDGDPKTRTVRPHWHVLICGFPITTLNLNFGCVLARLWYMWGTVDARLWVEGLGAFDYSTNIGANTYESGEFVQTVTIIPSESLKKLVPFFTGGNGEGEDAEQCDKSRNIAGLQLTESAVGLDQLQACPRGNCNTVASETWERSSEVTLSDGTLTRSPHILVAVNAARTGVQCWYSGGHHRRI